MLRWVRDTKKVCFDEDEEVCRVAGTWIGLDISTQKQCGSE